MSDNQPGNVPEQNPASPSQSGPTPPPTPPLVPPQPTAPVESSHQAPPAAPGAPYVAAPQYPQAAPAPAYMPGPAGPAKPKGLAITGMALGIAGLVFCWVPFFGPLLALVGLVLSIIALVKKQPIGFGITGVITGAIGLIIGIFITIGAMIALGALGQGVDALKQCENGAESVQVFGETVSCSTLTS